MRSGCWLPISPGWESYPPTPLGRIEVPLTLPSEKHHVAPRLDGPVKAIAGCTGVDVTIHADAFYYQGGEYDPYSDENDVDVVEFFADGERLTLDDTRSHTHRDLLTLASECVDLRSLGIAFRGLPDQDWVWVNYYMGVGFDLHREGKHEEAWEAPRLWNEVLSPLLPWFR